MIDADARRYAASSRTMMITPYMPRQGLQKMMLCHLAHTLLFLLAYIDTLHVLIIFA